MLGLDLGQRQQSEQGCWQFTHIFDTRVCSIHQGPTRRIGYWVAIRKDRGDVRP